MTREVPLHALSYQVFLSGKTSSAYRGFTHILQWMLLSHKYPSSIAWTSQLCLLACFLSILYKNDISASEQQPIIPRRWRVICGEMVTQCGAPFHPCSSPFSWIFYVVLPMVSCLLSFPFNTVQLLWSKEGDRSVSSDGLIWSTTALSKEEGRGGKWKGKKIRFKMFNCK